MEAEQYLSSLPNADKYDDEFHEVATRIFGERAADDAMYRRILDRGMERANAMKAK